MFQAKPQDFPYSQGWMMLAAVVLCAGIFASYPVQDETSLVVALIAIVHVAAYGFALWIALRIRSKPERFVQTAATIFGTAALLQLVDWPFVNWAIKVQGTPQAQFPLLIIFGLGVWTFAVAVNIDRHAMDVSVGQSILITLGLQVFAVLMVFILFGTLRI
ncbi:MAG: hypothetical protein WB783_07825 [Arenicellales bacterium]